jgi:Methylase of chemotaxis methyl-accepting proteins
VAVPLTTSQLAEEQLNLESLELQLLLEGIYRQYGFDFRQYAHASLRRRVWRRVNAERLPTISALLDRVLHDPDAMERLLVDLSVNVTAMFRDPTFFLAFREKIVPLLRTYPFTRVWVAGCSTGEEVYSLAITLQEEGLYERTRIYATDINIGVLERAREGVFPLEKMREYTENYIRAAVPAPSPSTTSRSTKARCSTADSPRTSSGHRTTSARTAASTRST